MLNLLNGYIENSLPEDGYFSTNPNLLKKVGEDGRFLPYFGNTVVFLLDEDSKKTLRGLQEALHREAGHLLARELDSDTFHMTLHDLENGPEWDAALLHRMARAEEQAKPLLEQWRELPPLRMRGTWLFNMVNTSIVLGLAPRDQDTWEQLDGMYTALEAVVPLGYGLTPHITMAYLKPGTWPRQELLALRKCLCPVALDVELSMEALVYQTFSDMNHYRTE